MLSSSTSLKKLNTGYASIDLFGDDSDNEVLPPEAVELIISGLQHNTTLKKLVMSHSHFSLRNTISLASVLRTNHTLVYLGLVQCNIDSDGACQLASALCTNTLNVLLLGESPFGVKGAAAIAKMLLKNKSLKELYLDNLLLIDSIGKKGIQKLIDSLTHNTTVETLKLPEKYKSSFDSSEVDSSES